MAPWATDVSLTASFTFHMSVVRIGRTMDSCVVLSFPGRMYNPDVLSVHSHTESGFARFVFRIGQRAMSSLMTLMSFGVNWNTSFVRAAAIMYTAALFFARNAAFGTHLSGSIGILSDFRWMSGSFGHGVSGGWTGYLSPKLSGGLFSGA